MTTYTITLRPHPETLYPFTAKTFTFQSGEYHICHLGGDDSGLCPPTHCNGHFPAPLPTFLSELTFYKSDFWFRDVASKADEHGSMLNDKPIRQVRDEDSAVVLADGDKLELGCFAAPVGSRTSRDFLFRIVFTVDLTRHSHRPSATTSSVPAQDCASAPLGHDNITGTRGEVENVRIDKEVAQCRDTTSVPTSVLAPPPCGSSFSPTTSDRPTTSSPLSSSSIPSSPRNMRWIGVQDLVHAIRTSTAAEEKLAPKRLSASMPGPIPAFVYSKFVETADVPHSAQTDATNAVQSSLPQEVAPTDMDLCLRSITAIPQSTPPGLDVRSQPSAPVASAVLAIRRARAAWIAARSQLLTPSSPTPAVRSPTPFPARKASIDLALDRFRSAWLSIRSQLPSIVSSPASIETFHQLSGLAAAPAPGISAKQLQHSLPRVIRQDANLITPLPFFTPDTSSCTRVHPSVLSPLPSSAPPSSPPVPSMTPDSVFDLSITSFWPALLMQSTALLCILALR
ncbi:hypothetical protein CF319_g9170 [Tilletia indica]|nr:hypothetical protein CF319_g9170 [Tilletia indica]